MKTNNNKKIIVSTLAIAMAAALAGSISGSVAWYQYSTRVTSTLSGATAGTARNLQLAHAEPASLSDVNDAAWGYHYDAGQKDSMKPTAVSFDKDGLADQFYSHPVYQYFNNWLPATAGDYFSYDLYFQSIDEEGNREALDVYFTTFDLTFDGATSEAAEMIEKAFRMEFVTYDYELASDWVISDSKIYAKEAGTTHISDYLNLNTPHNDVMDHNGFAADDSDGVATKYRAGAASLAETPEAGTILEDVYYTDAALEHPAWSTTFTYTGSESTSDEDLYFDEACTESVKNSGGDLFHVVNASVGDSAAGLYTDKELSSAAPTYHAVNGVIGGDGTDLFEDTGLSTPAANPLEANGVYYAAGVPAGTYYAAGLANGTYYAKYTKVSATRNVDEAAGLFEDAELSTPAVALSNGKVEVTGDYYKKLAADGSTEYHKAAQESYETVSFDGLTVGDANPYEFTGKSADKIIIRTNESYPVKLSVKIWLEGWAEGEAVSKSLAEGADGTGYYTDADCTLPVQNSHEVTGVAAGTDVEGLFNDEDLAEAAQNSHEVTASLGDDGSDLYNDPACTVKAQNSHKVTVSEGDDGTGLYVDAALTEEVVTDHEGKVVVAGTYYAEGVEAGTYYAKGVAAGDYHAFGVEAGTYYSRGYIWDADTIGTNFNLNMRFGVEADR